MINTTNTTTPYIPFYKPTTESEINYNKFKLSIDEIEKSNEEIQKLIRKCIDKSLFSTVVKAPIDPKYCPKVKEPTPSVDDLLDQGYTLRQIQQIMKGEN